MVFLAHGFYCSGRVRGSHWRLYSRRMPYSVVHLKKSACFYGESTVEGMEQGRKANLAAISAVLESSDGHLNWEVTAEVVDGDRWEWSFGERPSRTWWWIASWQWGVRTGKGGRTRMMPTSFSPIFPFPLPLSLYCHLRKSENELVR